MPGILIVDQIQNSSNTVVFSSSGATLVAANTIGTSQLQVSSVNSSIIAANTVTAGNLQKNSIESYLNTQGTTFGFRNRIINGAMVVDQRNAGSSISNPNNNVYVVDRWKINTSFTGSVGQN